MKATDIELLKNCETEAEWNIQCVRIKAENGGKYPDDWYQSVIMSGINAALDKDFDKTDIETKSRI